MCRAGAFAFKEEIFMCEILKELQTLRHKDNDAGEVFSGKPSKRKVRGFATPSSFTPEVSSEYLFHDSSRDAVAWFMGSSDPLYVFGPCGSGKTSLAKQLAAKLNFPVFELTKP